MCSVAGSQHRALREKHRFPSALSQPFPTGPFATTLNAIRNNLGPQQQPQPAVAPRAARTATATLQACYGPVLQPQAARHLHHPGQRTSEASMTRYETPLELAQRHVAEGEARVATKHSLLPRLPSKATTRRHRNSCSRARRRRCSCCEHTWPTSRSTRPAASRLDATAKKAVRCIKPAALPIFARTAKPAV
jgi:hypothetical protein